MPTHIDGVAAWKITSVAMTGFFGVLGLLTEYKDRTTHRVTRWGYISLAGIIVSTVAGVTSQFVEVSHAQIAADEANKRSIALSEQTSMAVSQIRRILTPIGSSSIQLWYKIPCDRNEVYQAFCARLWNDTVVMANIKYWPESAPNGPVKLTVSFGSDETPENPVRRAMFEGTGQVGPKSEVDFYEGWGPKTIGFRVTIPMSLTSYSGERVKSMADLSDGETRIIVGATQLKPFELTDIKWISESGDVSKGSISRFSTLRSTTGDDWFVTRLSMVH